MLTWPLHRLKGRQSHLAAPKRDQSSCDSEEKRVVGLDQVGDGMGRRSRKSRCSVSRYTALSYPVPTFFMLSFTLLGLVALPYLVSSSQLLYSLPPPSMFPLSSPLLPSFSAGGSASVIEGSFSFHSVGDKF